MSIHLDRGQIEDILPHREPFLFVDSVSNIHPGERIVGELRIHERLRFLARGGESPGLPPTILAEAMAQLGAILVLHPAENRGRAIYFRSIEAAEFAGPVPVGRTLRLEAEVRRMRARFGSLLVTAYDGNAVVAKGTMSFALG